MRAFPTFVSVALCSSFAFATAARGSEIPGVYVPWNDVGLGGIATLNGNVTVTLPSNQIVADVDPNGNLSGLHGTIELNGAVVADVLASGSGSFQASVPLAAIPMPIIPVNATTYVLPIIGLVGSVSGTAEAGARFALVEQFTTSLDLSLDSSGVHATLLGSPDHRHRFGVPDVSGTTVTNLEVSIIAGVTFQIVVGGLLIGGPTVAAEFAIEAQVDPSANPWWDVNASFLMTTSFIGPGVVLFTLPLGTFAQFDVGDAGGPFSGVGIAPQRWSRVYSYGSQEGATSIHALTDGFLVSGNTANVTHRAYLAKIGFDGTPQWEKRGQVLAFNSMRPVDVVSAANGDILLAGKTGTSSGARIERLDGNGGSLWAKSLTGPASTNIQLNSMVRSGTDGFLIAGHITHVTQSVTRPYVARLDGAGNVLFAKEFDPGAASTDGAFNAIAATADGGVLLTGRISYQDAPAPNTTIAQHNMFAVKLDASHALTFATVVGTTGWDEAFTAVEGQDGTFVLGGQTPSSPAPNVHSAMLVALTQNGALSWSKVYAGETINGSSGDTPFDAIADIVAVDGGYVVTGNTGLPGLARDAWMIGIDADGATTFFKSFRSDQRDEFAGLVAVGDEGFLAYGFTHKTDPALPLPSADLWLARTQSDGYLEFAPQYGIDCFNDHADWGHANAVVVLPMPGSFVDVALTIIPANQAYDAAASTTTVVSQ